MEGSVNVVRGHSALTISSVDFTVLSRESMVTDSIERAAKMTCMSKSCVYGAFTLYNTSSYIGVAVLVMNIIAMHIVLTSNDASVKLLENEMHVGAYVVSLLLVFLCKITLCIYSS